MAGNEPIREDITLTRGADFAHVFARKPTDPAIPDETTARIEITDTDDVDADIITTWAGTVTADGVRFRVESEATDLIDDRTHYRLLVGFPDTPNSLDLCWSRGSIRRQD